MIFLFGDTISKDVSAVNYHAADPLAWSTSTDPESGLLLNFYTTSSGLPLFVQPQGIKMGPDDTPHSGITLSDGVYLICNTGSDTSLRPNPRQTITRFLCASMRRRRPSLRAYHLHRSAFRLHIPAPIGNGCHGFGRARIGRPTSIC